MDHDADVRGKGCVNVAVEAGVVCELRGCANLGQRDEQLHVPADGVVELLRGGKGGEEVASAGGGIGALQVGGDVEGVADEGAGRGVVDDGQGVEVGAVGEFATRWHVEAGADAADVWHLDPGGCVGDGLEVEGQSGFPRVDGAACFCDGGPLGYVVEDDWGGGGGGGGGGHDGDHDGLMGGILGGKTVFFVDV